MNELEVLPTSATSTWPPSPSTNTTGSFYFAQTLFFSRLFYSFRRRKLHSIKTNPNYFSPPFAGVAFTPAAHHFVYALMANHSAERPEGILTPADLMTFFSYTRSPSGALIYTPGHEKIPEDWYKRAVTDPWTLGDIVAAVAQQCSAFPSTCAVGGNTGTVNSFAGIDPGDVSGGLFNAQAYRDPYKLGCFISFTIQSVRISLRRISSSIADSFVPPFFFPLLFGLLSII